MTKLKRHVFLVVALLVISATSYALSSENVAPNRDDGNSTHGQGRGSVRANEKVMDTLAEERAGEKVVKLFGAALSQPKDTETVTKALKQLAEKSEKEETQRIADLGKDKQLGHDLLDDGTPASGEKVVKLFGADISSSKYPEAMTKALKQLAETEKEETPRIADLLKRTRLGRDLLARGALVSTVVEKVASDPTAANELVRAIVSVKRKADALEEEIQQLKKQVADLKGKAGASKPNIIEGFIDEWGLDRQKVVERENFLSAVPQIHFVSNHRVRYMAVGSVYFEGRMSEPKFTGERTPTMKNAENLIDSVLDKFSKKGVNLDKSAVVNAALDMLSEKGSVPGNPVVVDMAIGKVMYDLLKNAGP